MSATGGTIRATYELYGPAAEAERRAAALAVEQSHEFPTELAPEHTHVSLARVVGLTQVHPTLVRAQVDFPADLAGEDLSQLLVLLFGNVSLQPGVRLVDVELPAALEHVGPGPRVGVDGLRVLLDAPSRPLLATALKPVGLSTPELAARAEAFALGGIDLVKDDQGLASQRWSPYEERVVAVAEAVTAANARTGGRTLYLPTLSGPAETLEHRVRRGLDAGVGGFLVLPGVGGLDEVRHVASLVPPGTPLMAHPALLGSFVADPTHGIAPELLFGPLLRLAGADVVVFPSFGGRFSFTREQCEAIAEGLARPFGDVPAALPAPGGGMGLDRVPELLDTYGTDVVLLIGGELHRGGDLRRAAEEFRAAVDR